MDRKEALELISLAGAYESLYPWQRDFIAASIENNQKLLMAANRVGKTLVAGLEMAFHLLGTYPRNWPGIRFEKPVNSWALGVSGEQIRDVIQSLLFGTYDGVSFTGGLIPYFMIRQVLPAQGTPKLAKDIHVQHKHGISVLSLKSYSQGQAPLMGSSIDFAWIDEEPQDPLIYPQVLIRTATGNQGRGGYVTITETPELGSTDLVLQFLEDRKPGQYMAGATWDDVTHLTDEVKQKFLDATPEYQREMRTKGIPVMGQGRIYTVAEERIKCDPFPIPDHWFRSAAIDFGLEHPTAVVWGAHDRDSDVIYVTDVYRQAGELPAFHGQAIRARESCPLIFPHDGDNREKGSGDTLAAVYRDAGVQLHVKFDNPDGTNYVEPGILEVGNRLRTGRLKIFSHLADWFSEYRLYHRKNGHIVKVRDDIMDATRYLIMTIPRYGSQRQVPESAYVPGLSKRSKPRRHRAYNA